MIKIAVCDDEKGIIGLIEQTIYDVCITEGITVDIDTFFNGEELQKEVFKGTRYDLIYLDIQMDNGNGIATAKNIRKIDETALLIYVSSYDQYMMELFRLDVFTFIKKPIDHARFVKTFLDAHRRICNQKFYFIYHYKSEEYKILCNDILYFESLGRKIIIHTKNGSAETFNAKLSEVEEWVYDGKIPFLRIHQSYLVNYHHIKSRSKTKITLINGMELPISEERQKCFGKQYSQLLGGEMNV